MSLHSFATLHLVFIHWFRKLLESLPSCSEVPLSACLAFNNSVSRFICFIVICILQLLWNQNFFSLFVRPSFCLFICLADCLFSHFLISSLLNRQFFLVVMSTAKWYRLNVEGRTRKWLWISWILSLSDNVKLPEGLDPLAISRYVGTFYKSLDPSGVNIRGLDRSTTCY